MCATCHVYVQGDPVLPPVGTDEEEMLECTAATREADSRLGCQLKAGRDFREPDRPCPQSASKSSTMNRQGAARTVVIVGARAGGLPVRARPCGRKAGKGVFFSSATRRSLRTTGLPCQRSTCVRRCPPTIFRSAQARSSSAARSTSSWATRCGDRPWHAARPARIRCPSRLRRAGARNRGWSPRLPDVVGGRPEQESQSCATAATPTNCVQLAAAVPTSLS